MEILVKFLKFSLLLSLSFIFSKCLDCARSYREYVKELSIYGVIKDQYLDKENHDTPTFILGEDNNINPFIGLRAMYLASSLGDTIRKDSGSLKFLLIKKDTIMIFYPKCRGNLIKE